MSPVNWMSGLSSRLRTERSLYSRASRMKARLLVTFSSIALSSSDSRIVTTGGAASVGAADEPDVPPAGTGADRAGAGAGAGAGADDASSDAAIATAAILRKNPRIIDAIANGTAK